MHFRFDENAHDGKRKMRKKGILQACGRKALWVQVNKPRKMGSCCAAQKSHSRRFPLHLQEMKNSMVIHDG